MAAITQDRIDKTARMLWARLYEMEFRGKERGRFLLTRGQLKKALNVDRLHDTAIRALQDAALALGLVIIDLDDVFPCIESRMARRYRRPPTALLDRLITETFPDDETPDIADEDDSDEE